MREYLGMRGGAANGHNESIVSLTLQHVLWPVKLLKRSQRVPLQDCLLSCTKMSLQATTLKKMPTPGHYLFISLIVAAKHELR